MTTKSLYNFCMENEDKKYLLDEWNYEENSKNGLYIEEIGFGSEKDVSWIGKCGHKWNASPYSRRKGNNCPYCSNHKVLEGYNDLATTHPELVKEWDFEKNEEIKPTNIVAGSKTPVWWICENGHSWKAIVSSRTEGKTGCPYCSNHKVLAGYNDLATTNPELAKEWHPTKNENLKPIDVLSGSHKKVWWTCKEGHEWETPIVDRVRGKGCPYCTNQKVLTGYNDLATTHPNLAKEWSPKNKEKANEVIAGSKKKFLWICENGHEWESDISNRKAGYSCPCCHNQTSIPEVMIYLTFKSLFENTYHRYKLENTEFDVYVKDINLLIEYDGDYWHNPRKEKDKRKNEIAQKHNLIFVRVWEYKDTKETVISNDKNTLYFNKKNGYETLVKEVVNHINTFYNLNINYIPNENEETIAKKYLKKEKYENSLAILNPDISAEWHPTKNGSIKPTMVTARSGEKVWWKCQHGHEWEAVISNRTNKEKGTGCPYCANKKILKGFNDLETTNPELAKEWHPTKNEGLNPSDVVAGSKTKAWWICNKGHEWEASILNRAKKHSGCPYCSGRKK